MPPNPLLANLASKGAALAHPWSLLQQRSAQDGAPLALIDLRSPREFAAGHIPGAYNVPLLDNDERATIGTLYKREGKIAAMQEGLELFAAKVDAFYKAIADYQSSRPDGKPLYLYCWRGGLRSRLVTVWLASLGHQVGLVHGGYKAYRRQVADDLTALAGHRLLVLNGRTGSGKTSLLHHLHYEGLPVLDFEGLACHRGSAFGGLAQARACPTQQQFENDLAKAYEGCRHAPLILVEIESVMGPIALTKPLRQNITASPMVFVSREFDDRVRLLTETYAEAWDDNAEEAFCRNLEHLRRFLSGHQYEELLAAIKMRRFADVAASLLRLRYDKAYDKSLHRHQSQAIASFNLSYEEGEALAFLRRQLTP